jgi:hypothetical protein
MNVPPVGAAGQRLPADLAELSPGCDAVGKSGILMMCSVVKKI